MYSTNYTVHRDHQSRKVLLTFQKKNIGKFTFLQFLFCFRRAQKLSEASEKQRRINELLNASHNSQVVMDRVPENRISGYGSVMEKWV